MSVSLLSCRVRFGRALCVPPYLLFFCVWAGSGCTCVFQTIRVCGDGGQPAVCVNSE